MLKILEEGDEVKIYFISLWEKLVFFAFIFIIVYQFITKTPTGNNLIWAWIALALFTILLVYPVLMWDIHPIVIDKKKHILSKRNLVISFNSISSIYSKVHWVSDTRRVRLVEIITKEKKMYPLSYAGMFGPVDVDSLVKKLCELTGTEQTIMQSSPALKSSFVAKAKGAIKYVLIPGLIVLAVIVIIYNLL